MKCTIASKYKSTKKHSKITSENYHNYIDTLRVECKKKLDLLGITDKNVGGISNCAKKMYSHGIFDEVETEYNTLIVLKR